MAEDQSAASRVLCGIKMHSAVDYRRLELTEKISKLGEPNALNLHISPEIRDYMLKEEYFKYALYAVLGIIEDKLSCIDKPYHIDVKLEIDPFNPKDRHSDIIVKIKDINHSRILDIWDDVGHSVGNFLTSLRDGAIMPVSAANRVYGFINLIFAPDI